MQFKSSTTTAYATLILLFYVPQEEKLEHPSNTKTASEMLNTIL